MSAVHRPQQDLLEISFAADGGQPTADEMNYGIRNFDRGFLNPLYLFIFV